MLTDRTTTIRASVQDVEFELLLTIALVVMVIFLFLRNLSATIIPSVAVPLSLVGTFGVMYLLGYSLNNLTLMALTISTGFVVDDAIVMIENIARYIEDGDAPLEAALKGLGADRLHDRVVDGLADRGADPAAVHGRYRGPPVPRIRDYAERYDPGFGGGLADAHADDVREAAQAHSRRPNRAGSTVAPECFDATIECYGTTLQWVLRHQMRRCWSRSARWCLRCAVYYRAQGLLSRSGYRRDPGRIGIAARRLFRRDGAAATAAGAGDFEGPRGREPVVVHRHRRDQHHRQQRAVPDQPQAAGGAQSQHQRSHRRLQPQLAKVQDITLFLQPVRI